MRLALGLHLAALTVAAAVALWPGATPAVRGWLALDLHPAPGTLAGAAAILVHNLLVLAPLLLGPPIVRWLGRGRRVLFAYATWQATVVVLSVGGAIGAYGPSLVPRLGHVPFEAAALAIACSSTPRRRNDVGIVFLLLTVSAGLETLAV